MAALNKLKPSQKSTVLDFKLCSTDPGAIITDLFHNGLKLI
jgi:hypothetical protein